MQKKENILTEVSVIRPILIILLVVYHSFIIYQGGWSEPVGFEPNETYWWISKASYSFMLEAFVLISGYVYAHQVALKPTLGEGKSLITNKLKRLILPSIIFSIIYFILDFEYKSLGQFASTVINGAGHMWFLPMLFWCFIGCYIINRIPINKKYKLLGLILIALVSYIPLPLRIGSTMYYLLFFYTGYVIYNLRAQISNWVTNKKVLLSWVVYICVFITFTIAISHLQNNYIETCNSIIIKALYISTQKLLTIIYASLGCFAIYITAVYAFKNKKVSPWIIKFGNISMGVYIIQQFVLIWLYYHTTLPIHLGSTYLPWAGLAITLIISTVGALMLKKLPYIGRLI